MKDETRFITHLVIIAFSILLVSTIRLSIIPMEQAQNVFIVALLLGITSSIKLYKLYNKNRKRARSN